ncbi:hypothetical protein NE237_019656 [Protea cynaroides]|uniref:Uncharacterized protein n=1 Tax=Protea cynaroides TaxID=273540 RepID=A0A9Q0K1K5_9MAGN|nr:hypothetical protein NE237_019656 [Protea cynaroides]
MKATRQWGFMATLGQHMKLWDSSHMAVLHGSSAATDTKLPPEPPSPSLDDVVTSSCPELLEVSPALSGLPRLSEQYCLVAGALPSRGASAKKSSLIGLSPTEPLTPTSHVLTPFVEPDRDPPSAMEDTFVVDEANDPTGFFSPQLTLVGKVLPGKMVHRQAVIEARRFGVRPSLTLSPLASSMTPPTPSQQILVPSTVADDATTSQSNPLNA